MGFDGVGVPHASVGGCSCQNSVGPTLVDADQKRPLRNCPTLPLPATRGPHREGGVTPVAGEIIERPAPIPRLAHVDAVRNALGQELVQPAVGEQPRSPADTRRNAFSSPGRGQPGRAHVAQRRRCVLVLPRAAIALRSPLACTTRAASVSDRDCNASVVSLLEKEGSTGS